MDQDHLTALDHFLNFIGPKLPALFLRLCLFYGIFIAHGFDCLVGCDICRFFLVTLALRHIGIFSSSVQLSICIALSIRLIVCAGVVRFVVVVILSPGFRSPFLQKLFAVRDGDLIIVRVNFIEGKEAVAIAAIFNKGRL